MTNPIDPLAQRVLDFAARQKPAPCEVCGEPCSWTNDDGRTIHPTCDPVNLQGEF